MAELIYALCTGAALFCTILLLRGYARTRTRLLLWSAVCFLGLTINNLLVLVDLVVLPETNLFQLRSVTALVGVTSLLVGLIWEGRQ
jgi:hypothetical protein